MNSDEMLEKLKFVSNTIKTKEYLPFYFFFGNEYYFMSSIKKSILKSFGDEDSLNIKTYTKDNFDIDDITKYIGNMPFMSDKKLIIFDNVDYFKKVKSLINDDEILENSDKDKLIDAFEKSKDINIVLVFNYEYDSNYIKSYSKQNPFINFFGKNGIALELKQLDENSLWKYIQNRFKKSNKEIDRVNIAYLIRNCGKDLTNLFNEVDKIIAYTGDKKNIDKSDIDDIITKKFEDKIFTLIDLYNSNKNEEAMKCYGELLAEGEKPDDIFRTFSYNYGNLIVCKDFMEKGKGQKEISELMGIESWQANKLMIANKYVNMSSLKTKINKITNLSISMVKGNINNDLMLLLLMN